MCPGPLEDVSGGAWKASREVTLTRGRKRRSGKLCLRLRYRGIPRRVRVSLDEAGRVGGGQSKKRPSGFLRLYL